MRVIFVGVFAPPRRGTYQVCSELANRLESSGLTVVRTSRAANGLLRGVDMLRTVWSRRLQYDAVHVDVFSGRAFTWAEGVTRLAHRLGKPTVLTLHGGALPEFSERHPGRVTSLLRQAVAVTTPSDYLRDVFKSTREDMALIPNGIDFSAYSRRPECSSQPRIIWLRAFHRMYAPDVAVHSLALLRESGISATLRMIGRDKDGSLANTRSLAERLGVAPYVTFVPGVRKEEVPRELSMGSVFLNTTTVDNTPVSIIEAMATGLPIVSTEVGGIPYLLTHGEEALLVRQGDVAGIVSALTRLLGNPLLAERYANRARRKAQSFDWSVVLPRWHALFEGILHRRPLEPPG